MQGRLALSQFGILLYIRNLLTHFLTYLLSTQQINSRENSSLIMMQLQITNIIFRLFWGTSSSSMKIRGETHMCHAMWKRVFGYMRTAKANISLRIRAVWSGLSPFNYRILEKKGMYQWRAHAQMRLCACAGWCESAHSAHARRYFFAWHSCNETKQNVYWRSSRKHVYNFLTPLNPTFI